MTETTNYKLKKPGDSDNVRVDVLNGNMDVIDRELKQRAVLGPDGKVPEGQLPEMDISKALAGAELKDQPVDNDGVVITDSAAENTTKRILWSRIKAALSELYAGKSHTHAWGTITGKPETFQPAAHASTHGSGGSDPVTPGAIGAAAENHTHLKAQITDFPASLPANGGNAATVGGLSPDQLIAQAVAQGCRIATGSYVGTGTYGSANPCTLTFPFLPKLVLIKAQTCTCFVRSSTSGTTWAYECDGGYYTATWGANFLSWYDAGTKRWYGDSYGTTSPSSATADYQLNKSGRQYHYVAIG